MGDVDRERVADTASHPVRSGMALLREESDHDAALERSIVLQAMGIAHEILPTPDGRWALIVDDAAASKAEAALAEWEAENLRRPEPPARADYGSSFAGVAAGLGIVAFAAHAGFPPAGRLVEQGSAEAVRMLNGEWWRAVTALTLHADVAHAGANAAALALFVGAVTRRLGPALATWLTLAGGVAGNVVTALVAPGGHASIGASTAVFAALGTLSALQVPRRRAWLTLGAGVALLGFLGTGARADLLAHLVGFVAGLTEGLAVRRMGPPPRSLRQPVLAFMAVAPIALAWWRALTGLA